MTGFKDKVLYFEKKYVMEFVKNYKTISKFITVNYNDRGPKITITTKKI